MPPVNSPVEARATSRWPQELIHESTHIQPHLSRPYYDSASVFTYNMDLDDDVSAENVSFLRRHHSPIDEEEHMEWQEDEQERRRTALETLSRQVRDDQRRRRARPMTMRTPAVHNSATPSGAFADPSRTLPRPISSHPPGQDRAAYGNGVPATQSLYDWAPETDIPTTTSPESERPQLSREEFDRIWAQIRAQESEPQIARRMMQHSERLREERERLRDERARREQRRRDLETARRQQAVQEDHDRNFEILRQSQTPASMLAHQNSSHSAAILREVRRSQDIPPRSRDAMARYVQEREGRHQDQVPVAGSPAELHSSVERHARYLELGRQVAAEDARRVTERDVNPRSTHIADALRRGYLDNPKPSKMPESTSEFSKIIEHLHLHAMINASNESDLVAVNASNGITPEHAFMTHSMHRACPPHPSTWLTAGMTFTGTQQSSPLPNSQQDLRSSWQQAIAPSSTEIYTHPTGSSANLPYSPPPPDRWVMRVTLHNVDFDTMTLQGTMEAFNVSISAANTAPHPTTSGATDRTTFSTFLTGELIDFHHHTLLTVPPNTPRSPPTSSSSPLPPLPATTPSDDATHWRLLPPFSLLTDEDLARVLLDPDWIEREIAQKYILMRWKERCFVAPTYEAREGTVWDGGVRPPVPAGREDRCFLPGVLVEPASQGQSMHGGGVGAEAERNANAGRQFGLSISGFYYVSLRRSDGELEGLYYDRNSQPFHQMLRMGPEWKGGVRGEGQTGSKSRQGGGLWMQGVSGML